MNKKRISQVAGKGKISLVDVVRSGAVFGCVAVWLQIMWVGLKRAGKQTPARK